MFLVVQVLIAMQASYDIEVYSHDNSFPQPEEQANCVIQIATTFQRLGEEEPYYQHLVNLGGCSDIEGVDVVRCADEMEVLLEWRNAIHAQQADVLIGYNTFGFDCVSDLGDDCFACAFGFAVRT